MRVGGYRSVLDKPHESIIELVTETGDWAALIVETRLTGWGGFAQLESPRASFLLRLGTVDFDARGDLPADLLYAVLDPRVRRG